MLTVWQQKLEGLFYLTESCVQKGNYTLNKKYLCNCFLFTIIVEHVQCLRDFGTVEMMVVVITWLSDCVHMSLTATLILPFPD
jgi:hypothetical protein